MPAAATVAELAVVINADTSGVEKGLAAVGQQVSGFGQSMQSVFAGIGAGIGMKAFDTVVQGIKTATDVAIGFNSKMEQSTIAFTSMLGSAEKAQAFLSEMKQFAATTPFEFPDLLDASKKMLAFGFAAQDVKPLLTAVGSASAAMGSGKTGVEAITNALGQMRAATVVQAGELNQLTEQGVPAFQILADAMGISTGEVKKLASEGKIASDVFITAFQEWASANYGDMMAKQAVTFEGAMSTIKDSLTFAVANAFKPFFEQLSDLAVEIAAFVQTAEFTEWADSVATALRELLPLLKTFAVFLWENRDAIVAVAAALATFVILTTVIGWITAIAGAIAAVTAAISASGGVLAALGALVAILGGPVTLIIAAIALAVGVLAYAWSENWGDIQGKTEAVVDFLSGVPDTVSGFFTDIGHAAEGLQMAVEAAWQAIEDTTTEVWNGITQFLTDWWRELLVVLTGPIGLVAVLIIDNWQTIADTTETIFNAIKNVLIAIWDLIYTEVIQPKLQLIATFISTTWDAIKLYAETVLNGLLTFIRDTIFEPIRAAVEAAINAARDLFGLAVDAIKAKAEAILNPLLTWWQLTIWEPVRLAVEAAINGARDLFGLAVDAIKAKAEAILNPLLTWWQLTIWEPIKAAVEGASTAITTAFQTSVNAVKTTVDTTMEGVKNAWETTWSAIQKAAESPKAALQALKDLISGIVDVTPKWLIPHSPTPFQVGLEGVMKAVSALGSSWAVLGSAVHGASGEIADYISEAARARGIDPIPALKVAQHEGGLSEYNKLGDFSGPPWYSGKSWWPFQLHYGGAGTPYAAWGSTAGMGNDFSAKTHWRPGDPDAWRASVDFALDHAAKHGWGAWYGRGPAGVGAWEGIPGHAGGGWAGLHGPELAWLGERGPEYVVPNAALRGGGSAGPIQSVSMPIVIGNRVIEELWITGRDLAIRRGRVPGAGAASMGSLA